MTKLLRTSNPIIGTGYKTLSKIKDGEVGPIGPPGADGDIESFPDTLPDIPVISTKLVGIAGIDLSWTFENKLYYSYEIYGSKTKDFTPSKFNLIHEGLTASYLYQAKPSETWYFKARAKNSHGRFTDFSAQAVVTTIKINDLSDFVEKQSIGSALIGNAIIETAHIQDAAIKNAKIDKLAVGTANIQDAAITNAKIDNLNADKITAGDISADRITTQVINAINANIGNAVIDSAKIADLNADKITAGTINADRIGANSITAGKIDANAITTDKLHAGSVVASKIAADAITTEKLDAESVTAEKIKAGAIVADKIEAGAVTAGKIAANAITAGNIQAGAIQAGHLSANSVGAGNIQAGAIQAGSGIIANGAIGTAQISELEANKIAAGTIDTSKVTVASKDAVMEITGNQIMINDSTNPLAPQNRVTLGQYNTPNGEIDYGLVVRSKDGQTTMIDGSGVHNAGITDGAIDNNKVSDNANINGKKLDINSVIRTINDDGSETIAGTKIQVGDRTLDIELKTQNQLITDNKTELSSQKTQIKALDDSIKLKVDSQTYEKFETTITDKVTDLENTVPYSVEIIASNGSVFTNGDINTTLTIRVLRGTDDITHLIDDTKVNWTRQSMDYQGDIIWNEGHVGFGKEIHVTAMDLYKRATFSADVIEIPQNI